MISRVHMASASFRFVFCLWSSCRPVALDLRSVVKPVEGAFRNREEAMSAPSQSIRSEIRPLTTRVAVHRQAVPSDITALHGIVSLEDLKTLPRERWHLTKARDVMRPIAPRFFVEPNAKLDYARELMKRNGIGSLAVVGKNGELVGFLQSGRFKRKKRSKSASS